MGTPRSRNGSADDYPQTARCEVRGTLSVDTRNRRIGRVACIFSEIRKRIL